MYEDSISDPTQCVVDGQASLGLGAPFRRVLNGTTFLGVLWILIRLSSK